ncbi:Cyclin-U2-1 [Hondaea fermentalgiana]|uniref:Cyclin-U2-1 n=1 Tax=Hondaea fermentalgiana TaxID=2315210 RepID=A0A2R5GLZ1_9STRA|nr:Cyclin-U2-1 [Hondaea fermentalgiana]|eukprot:GBG31900.1 Cyclin-U2-1 [Hondaea fermentalgiana]
MSARKGNVSVLRGARLEAMRPLQLQPLQPLQPLRAKKAALRRQQQQQQQTPSARLLPEAASQQTQARSRTLASGEGGGVNEEEVIRRLSTSLWALASQEDLVESEKRFSVGTVPKRAMDKYVQGIVGFLNDNHDGEATTAGVSPGLVAAVVAVIFVDRLMQRHKDFRVCRSNVHRLFLTAVTLAAKTWRDKAIPNKFMAAVGGIPLQQLNTFELDFCKMVGFDLSSSADEFWHSLAILLNA